MDDDAIFAIVSHGEAGRFKCYNDTYISARIVNNDSSNYSLDYIYDYNDFDKMKLAYIGTCKSAKYNSIYGDLLDQCVDIHKAESAVGFYNSVKNLHAIYFEQKLFYKLRLGNTVGYSVDQAVAQTIAYFGTTGAIDSVEIAGNENTKIIPAAYSN